MSPIPRHVPWGNPEPHHKGHFGYHYSTASNIWYDPDADQFESGNIIIPASGAKNVDFPAGNVAEIYRAKISSANGNSFAISLFERGARSASDFLVNMSSQMETESDYLIFQGKDLIISVDKDNTEYIHAIITGTPADVLTVEFDMVRLP